MFLSIQNREKNARFYYKNFYQPRNNISIKIFVENHTRNSSSILASLYRAYSLRRHGEQNKKILMGLLNLALNGLD